MERNVANLCYIAILPRQFKSQFAYRWNCLIKFLIYNRYIVWCWWTCSHAQTYLYIFVCKPHNKGINTMLANEYTYRYRFPPNRILWKLSSTERLSLLNACDLKKRIHCCEPDMVDVIPLSHCTRYAPANKTTIRSHHRLNKCVLNKCISVKIWSWESVGGQKSGSPKTQEPCLNHQLPHQEALAFVCNDRHGRLRKEIIKKFEIPPWLLTSY